MYNTDSIYQKPHNYIYEWGNIKIRQDFNAISILTIMI